MLLFLLREAGGWFFFLVRRLQSTHRLLHAGQVPERSRPLKLFNLWFTNMRLHVHGWEGNKIQEGRLVGPNHYRSKSHYMFSISREVTHQFLMPGDRSSSKHKLPKHECLRVATYQNKAIPMWLSLWFSLTSNLKRTPSHTHNMTRTDHVTCIKDRGKTMVWTRNWV